MNEVTEKDKKMLKGITKFLYILFKSLVPTIVKHVKIDNNKITMNYRKSSYEMRIVDKKTVIYADGEKVGTEKDTEVYDFVNKYFNKYSNKQLIGYSEAYLIIVIAYMYLSSIVLKLSEKLFKNINTNKTPLQVKI